MQHRANMNVQMWTARVLYRDNDGNVEFARPSPLPNQSMERRLNYLMNRLVMVKGRGEEEHVQSDSLVLVDTGRLANADEAKLGRGQQIWTEEMFKVGTEILELLQV